MDSFSMVSATAFYQFKINHSETKDLGIGNYITSPKFSVGGHDWVIKYYPQGNTSPNSGKYMSVFLKLRREYVDVRAAISFVLLDKHGNVSPTTLRESAHTFTSHKIDWGFSYFIQTKELEEKYIQDDCFVLSVSVSAKSKSFTDPVPRYHPTHFVQHSNAITEASSTSSMASPCDRIQNFREENKQTDVTFDVASKRFAAHRIILAAYSPVFEAEFFGSMAESNMDNIMINEMMPSVFKAMLDFMYKGSLTVNEKLIDADEPMSYHSFLQNLLAAADRYAVEQLKTLCEHKLIKSISTDTVLSTLELAEKHNCYELKEDCVRFIVDRNNFSSLMFSEGYFKLMHNNPTLLAELKDLAEKCNLDQNI
jgi:speckle-type POZ protein